MHDDDVRAVLDRTVPPMPPSRVDPALAIRTARQRRRRTLTVAAAAIAVPVVVLAGAVAIPRGGGAPVTPATAPPATAPPAAADAAAALTAPRAFDPLVRTLDVGWVPPGYTEKMIETGGARQALAFNPPGPVDEKGLYVAILVRGQQFNPAERSFGMDGAEEPIAKPAPPIRGGKVVCLTGSCASIRWEYDDGAWAWISYGGPGDPARTARRVAESLSLGAREPVRMPFRLTGRTAKLSVGGAMLFRFSTGRAGDHGEHWSAYLTLVEPGSKLADPYNPKGVQVGVLDRPASAGPLPNGKDPAANTEIDGAPAYVSSDGRSLVRWGVRGTRLNVEVHDARVTARYVHDDLRLVDRPTDTSTWVSPV